MRSVAFIVAAIAATATALQITEPTNGAQWDLSQTNTVKWSFVTTDETEFELKLIDKTTSPETQIPIASKIKTSDGKYDLTNFVAPPGDKYTIKAFSLSKTNSGQLAESQTFNVTKSGVAPTTTSASPSQSGATGTGAAPTASKTNAAAALGQAIGVAGPVAIVFAMFL